VPEKKEEKVAEKKVTEQKEITPNSNFTILTDKYRVNIQPMGGGKYMYRSWSVAKSDTDKPDITLKTGTCLSLGNGDLCFEFTNNAYLYQCYVWKNQGTHSSPAEIIIFKNGKEYSRLKARVK